MEACKFKRRKTLCSANMVVNQFRNYREIILYKNDFCYFKGKSDTEVDRSRKYFFDTNHILCCKCGDMDFRKLFYCLFKSSKRAKDNFFGYGLSNKWDYFITLTIDPNRFLKDDKSRKKYLHAFENLLLYYDPDVKFLAVPEEHHNDSYGGKNNGTLHFHGLISFSPDFDCSKHFVAAVNAKTGKPITTKSGQSIYNFSASLWKYGFSSIVPIEGDTDSQEKVVYYMCKYMFKEQDFKYNSRRFYHSRNLAKKDKKVLYVEHYKLMDMMNNLFYSVVKDTAKMIVLKIYNENAAEFDKFLSMNRRTSANLRRKWWLRKFKDNMKRVAAELSPIQCCGERILTVNKEELEFLDTIF